MNKPVVLWDARARQTATSDEGGLEIIKSVLAPINVPGPYESISSAYNWNYVPPLTYLCIQRLLHYPDQIYSLGHTRLFYRQPSLPQSFDILRALIPSNGEDWTIDFSKVDPRLWAVLIQIYSNLPPQLHTYCIPLSDRHVPLLQRIPSTTDFTLITVLDLPECPELTDTTIVELKQLHSLCALNASGTTLSSYGIKSLTATLICNEEHVDKRGPWGLRILSLRNCRRIDNAVFKHLAAFVLLSVVDLRGSRCLPNGPIPSGFQPSNNANFFHPYPLSIALSLLSSCSPSAFSSKEIFTLYIDTLIHRKPHHTASPVSMEDTYVVLPSIQNKPGKFAQGHRIKVGNTHVLQRRMELKEDVEKHENNKEAWYIKNADRLGRGERTIDTSEYGFSCDDGHYDEFGEEESGSDEDGSSEVDMDHSQDEDDYRDHETDESEDDFGHEDIDGVGQLAPDVAEAVWEFFLDQCRSKHDPTGAMEQMGMNHTSSPEPSPLPRPTPMAAPPQLLNRPPYASEGDCHSAKKPRLSSPAPDLEMQDSLSPSSPSLCTRLTMRDKDLPSHTLSLQCSQHGPLEAQSTLLSNAIVNSQSNLNSRDLPPSRKGRPSDVRQSSDPSSGGQGSGLPNPISFSRQSSRGRQGGITSLSFEHVPSASGSSEPLSLPGLAGHPLEPPSPRGRSRSTITRAVYQPLGPVFGPGPPELNLQNAIAETEINEYASRQAADSFYRRQRPVRAPLHRNHEAHARPAPRGDAKLMLFRDPPPWNTLEDLIENFRLSKLAEGGTRQAPGVTAILNRGSAKAKTGMEGVMELVQRRTKIASEAKDARCHSSHTEEEMKPLNGSRSRNPFAKRSTAEQPLTNHRNTNTITTMSPTFTKATIRDLARPLKPISSLAVPPLPGATPQHPTQNQIGTSVPETTISGKLLVNRAACHTKCSTADREIFKRPLGTFPSVPFEAKTDRVRITNGIKPRSVKKGKERIGGAFDWNGWGTK